MPASDSKMRAVRGRAALPVKLGAPDWAALRHLPPQAIARRQSIVVRDTPRRGASRSMSDLADESGTPRHAPRRYMRHSPEPTPPEFARIDRMAEETAIKTRP
jgi:hypothetical protein